MKTRRVKVLALSALATFTMLSCALPEPVSNLFATPTPTSTPTPIPSPTPEFITPDQDLAAILASAPDGATLPLGPGTFHLSQSLLINASLTLIGRGPGQTRIVSSASEEVLRFSGSGMLTVRGIAFEYSGSSQASILVFDRGTADITDIELSGAIHDEGLAHAALVVEGSASVDLQVSRIYDSPEATGIVARDNATLIVENCVIDNVGLGIAVIDRAEATIVTNEVRETLIGFLAAGEASAVLRDNIFAEGELLGIFFDDETSGSVTGNQVSGSSIGIMVSGASSPTIVDNEVFGCTNSIAVADTASPTIGDNNLHDNDSNQVEPFTP
ncbi:MAG: right-handed parallel beta-helix repeat-containing protein [Anaerolineales bacterium]|nr:right-handed parallel beta-helix repeat-containing protein [Anaerolineales bacterium]